MPLIASAPTDRIILGLMTFGPNPAQGARISDPGEFNKCLDYFQSRGYNEVDTAPVYVGGNQEAFTREAKWKDRGLTLATKVKYPKDEGAHKADKVVASVESSLKELGTDCIDILYIHAADRSTPFAETLESLDKLHKAGKFVRLGVSNFTAAEVAEAVMICKYNGWVRPTIYQGMYNAITRGIEAELIPVCRRYGLDIVVYNPVAGGLFSGKIKSMDIEPEKGSRFHNENPSATAYRHRYYKESTFKALQTIEKALEKHPDLTLIEVALRWTVHHSQLKIKGGTDGILIGISSFTQLENNLNDLEKGPLPEDVVQALDEAWMIAKADAPNYWHMDLKYTYDTKEALFGAGANIRLSTIPTRPSPNPTRTRSPSNDSDIEDYIGSGADTAGGRTPRIDQRLSFDLHSQNYDSDDEDYGSHPHTTRRQHQQHQQRSPGDVDILDDSDFDSDDDSQEQHNVMSDPHTVGLLRPNEGRSATATPLLKNSDDQARGRPRYDHSRATSPLHPPPRPPPPPTTTGTMDGPARAPVFTRRSTMRSRSPGAQAKLAARKKYTYAGIFLTELGRYVQHDLGWNKSYCMLYLTHGSWTLLWPAQLLILRAQKQNRHVRWAAFWRRHVYELEVPRHVLQRTSPVPYLLRTTAWVTCALTVAGLSWYVAVNMTSPSDLTAIYNCSAFFAYAFSVPLLREKLRLDKSVAVLIAIAGVLVVAYGDSPSSSKGEDGGNDDAEAGAGADQRFLGNMIIGAGSVLYGLYEVLYKRWACPPEGTAPGRGMIFANAFGSCIGAFTLLVLWTFELPTGEAALYLAVSVVMNATFAGSFLVLISLTSPVLSSVAALLTIFIALSPAALLGGAMIVVAFLMLSYSTWREMVEDAERKASEHDRRGVVGGGGGGGGVDWSSDDDSDKDNSRLV
ncbi:NADP-dependent oxidoreductase domain-containing protein [Xylariomycetidae sp. FL2044]|nr:NADP-dependent oxidoreductase domain-containing protein [Xylariomycetidae sp. FL2044]